MAVECLSSQAAVIAESELDLDSKKCERFCTFIERYLPDGEKSDDERDQTLFRKLLKTVYCSHRSAFVHGGKEVSSAALMADKVGSSYFKHATEGQEVRTPGLGWFAHVVQRAVMGYLSSISSDGTTANEHLLAELAFGKAALRIKAKKDMKVGQVATFSDVEYR